MSVNNRNTNWVDGDPFNTITTMTIEVQEFFNDENDANSRAVFYRPDGMVIGGVVGIGAAFSGPDGCAERKAFEFKSHQHAVDWVKQQCRNNIRKDVEFVVEVLDKRPLNGLAAGLAHELDRQAVARQRRH
jgi:hypothetical protein